MPRDNEIQLTLSRFQIYSTNDNETSQTYVFSYSIYSEEKHDEHFSSHSWIILNLLCRLKETELKTLALGPV